MKGDSMFRILVAEDNKAIQMYYEDELTEAGYEVITTGDAPRIMALISEGWPDLVVLDIGLGNCDSLDFLQHIKNNDHRLPVIIYTAYPSFENDLRSVAADCYCHAKLQWLGFIVLIIIISSPFICSAFEVKLAWDPNTDLVDGYRIFIREETENYVYDTPEWEGSETTCTVSGLAEGIAYCFVARAFNEYGESADSNEVRASTVNLGYLETGQYETIGKGKNRISAFVLATDFNAGEDVSIHVYLEDESTGLPIANATVEIAISGSENLTLISIPSGSDGVAEAIWKTTAPKKKTSGTAPGNYEATATHIMAEGCIWDGLSPVTTFVIQSDS